MLFVNSETVTYNVFELLNVVSGLVVTFEPFFINCCDLSVLLFAKNVKLSGLKEGFKF
jgi:hypothetical protein